MITLLEAKAQLRVDADEHESDPIIEALIETAILTIENRTRRCILSAQKTAVFDGFPVTARLPWWPVQSVLAVSYTSPAGDEMALINYDFDNRAAPAKIFPVFGESWPETNESRMNVSVTAQVGYEVMPSPLKSAALLLIGHLFENRESVVVGVPAASLPLGFEMLIAPYVLYRVA